MGDDDDGVSVLLHPAEDPEELLDLLHGEHGGGLVQNDDLGPVVEHLDDLQRLLLRDGHALHLFPGVQIKAEALGGVGHLLVPVPAQGEARSALAHPDVVRGGEHVHQLEVLMDHADAQPLGVLRRGDDGRLPVHQDLPLVRGVDAGEHVHQRGLARPVLSQEGQDLPLFQGQIHILVGHDAAEGLGDPRISMA